MNRKPHLLPAALMAALAFLSVSHPNIAAAEPVANDNDLLAAPFEALAQQMIDGAGKRPQTLAQIPSAVSIIEAKDIRRYGWTTLGEALESLPGVHVSYDRAYHSIGIRGFGRPGDYNSRILMLIDGVPLNDGAYDTAPIGDDFPLDLEVIRRIEFIPGAGSVLFGGNAMLGVVNIVTHSGALIGNEIDASVGSAGERRLRVSTGGRTEENGTWLLSASQAKRRGEDLYFESYALPGANAWSRNLDRSQTDRLLARYELGGLVATLIAGERNKRLPGGAYGVDLNDPGNHAEDRRVFGSVRYERHLGESTRMELFGYTGSYVYRSAWVYGGVAQPDSLDNRWLGGEMNLVSTRFSGQTLLVGLTWRDDVTRRQFNPSLNINSPRHKLGIFVQDDWAINPVFTLSAGIREDRESSNIRHTNPRLALLIKPQDGTVLKISDGTAYRAANAFETDYAFAGTNLPNPLLKHEQLRTKELIVEQQIGTMGKASASLYRTEVENLIQLETDPTTGLQQHRNIGRVIARGGSLSIDGQLHAFRAEGSLTWQHVTHESGAELPNAPRLLAKGRVWVPLPKEMELAWELKYTGRRLTDSGDVRIEGSPQGGFAISNATLSGRLFHDAQWQLRVTNVFDRRYHHVVGAEFNANFPGVMSSPMPVMMQDGRALHARITIPF